LYTRTHTHTRTHGHMHIQGMIQTLNKHIKQVILKSRFITRSDLEN